MVKKAEGLAQFRKNMKMLLHYDQIYSYLTSIYATDFYFITLILTDIFLIFQT